MKRHHAVTLKFPGKPAVLKALRAAGGTWTPADVARWGRCNGGTRHAYDALAHYVEQGKLCHYPKHDGNPEQWVYVPRYVPAESQITEASA